MKWTYSIKNKLAAAILLGVVLGLVMLNNLDERNNSARLQKAFTSLYEDRLVVEGYILTMSEELHDIITISETTAFGAETDKQARLSDIISDIHQVNTAYAKTQLTENEEMEFNSYKKTIHQLETEINAFRFEDGKSLAEGALASLRTLSKIQLQEAQRVKKNSDSIFNYEISSSQFEMAILIIIAVIIQALVFSSSNFQIVKKVRSPALN